MGYYINLSELDLTELKERLINRRLVPSRQLLRNDIDAIFTRFSELEIQHMEELLKRINTKKRLETFTTESGISEEYLTILSRELRSWLPKPNKIADFPEMPLDVVQKLEQIGIKNTQHLFEYILTPENRTELAESAEIDLQQVLLLARLTDLSRIRWVNHTFAHMLVVTGYDSTQRVQQANAEEMHKVINDLNKKEGYYHHPFALTDFVITIEASLDVSLDVVY